MKQITVVTTFHKPGLELYGQRFLDSWAEHVHPDIKLKVYTEKCTPINPDEDSISIIPAEHVLEKLEYFKETWKDVPKANGIPPENIKARRPRDWHKKFKWDAIRFANKTYAVFDAATKAEDWLVWMDADTVVHSYWDHKDFSELLPDDKWLTFVGRGKGSQTWPECGFYGMNLKDPVCQDFLREFERVYEDAENGIFLMEEWHDSFVFGQILNRMRIQHPNVLDYSEHMYLKEAKTGGGGHPLINSDLGKWIDHMKGDRKTLGKSKPSDIMVNNRTESYWRT
tara:strand:+ start:131 stop:979 length:849 start_codon:yes stop_codon:yes gene_type:complete